MRERPAVLKTVAVLCGLVGCGGDDTAERYITDVPAPFAAVTVDERVWVAAADELVGLDLTELSVTDRSPLPARPSGVFVLDGVVWTTSWEGARPIGVAGVGAAAASSDRLHDSLAIVEGRVFAIRDGGLYELDPDTGDELALVTLPAPVTGGEQIVSPTPLVTDGSSLWLTVADGGTSRLARLDPIAGTFDRDVRIPDATTSAVLVGDRLWIADRRGELLSIDTVTGEPQEVASGFPKGETILDDGPSLFAGDDGTLWALDQPAQTVSQLDPTTGAVVATSQLRYRPSSMAVTATELVFANASDDRITVLARSELEPPT